jgi:hypothetical protein
MRAAAAIILVLTSSLVSGCSAKNQSVSAVATTTSADPTSQACDDVALASKLQSEAVSGAFTSSELVPQLQQVRDRLFSDAEAVGFVTTRKVVYLNAQAGAGDVVYQLGLRAGGLAAGLDAGESPTGGALAGGMTSAQANAEGVKKFSVLAANRLSCP